MAKCIHGYWGRSTWKRVEQDQTAEKIRVRLEEKLIARGQPAWLYLPMRSDDAGVIACTCLKETTESAQRDGCPECYGTGYAPGYKRFMFETVFAVASNAENYTLTNCTIVRDFKPNPIMLASGQTSGTIVTTDQAYSNAASDNWSTDVASYIRASGNTVSVEFSTDAGANWYAISAINGANKPTGTGNIRFRITLTRSAATDRSPTWHAVRARHLRSANYNSTLLTLRGNLSAGQILVLRPWVVEQSQSDTGRGALVDWMSDRSWTMPLDYFDTSITINTPDARVDDRSPGPHPFYEFSSGIKTGERNAITNVKWNEELGVFTHQSFDDRRTQTEEQPYKLVW